MAVLKAKARNKLKAGTFGLPKQRKYPMPNKSHAADAEGRVTQALAKGDISPQDAAKVRHKAHVVLGTADSVYHNQ